MKLYLSVIVLVFITTGFSGCSYKYYRNKPYSFLSVDTNLTINTNTTVQKQYTLKVDCIDADENQTVGLNKLNKCDGYSTIDISPFIQNQDSNNSQNIGQLAPLFLYVADSNCQRFVDKFHYNYFMGGNASKLLSLNILGVGFSLGEIREYSDKQLGLFRENLKENLQTRAKLRVGIENKVNTEKYQNMTTFFNDLNEYDNLCSLYENFDNNGSK